jgi:hypothetical protein
MVVHRDVVRARVELSTPRDCRIEIQLIAGSTREKH